MAQKWQSSPHTIADIREWNSNGTCGRHPTGIVRGADWCGPAELFPIMERALLHSSQDRFRQAPSSARPWRPQSSGDESYL